MSTSAVAGASPTLTHEYGKSERRSPKVSGSAVSGASLTTTHGGNERESPK